MSLVLLMFVVGGCSKTQRGSAPTATGGDAFASTSRPAKQVVAEQKLSALPPTASLRKVEPEHFSFTRDTRVGTVILLSERERVGIGVPKPIGHAQIERALKPETDLSSISHLRGKRFRIYPDGGEACSVTPTRFIAYAEAQPSGCMTDRWEGMYDFEKPVPEAQRAVETLELAKGREWVALLAPGQSCGDSLSFARLATLEAPIFYEEVFMPYPLRKPTRRAFEQLPGTRKVRAVQKEKNFAPEPGGPSLRAYRGPTGAHWTAVVDSASQTSDDYHSFFAFFRYDANVPVLLSDPRGTLETATFPLHVFDLDRDGTPELLFENLLIGREGLAFEHLRYALPMNYDNDDC